MTKNQPAAERSVVDLFGELADETGRLVRQEVKLAAAEMTRKAEHVGRQVAYAAAGLLLGAVGLLCVTGAVVLGVATTMPLWAAALIVGLVVLVVAAAVVTKALSSLRRMSPLPRRTIRPFQEDKQWVAEQIQ